MAQQSSNYRKVFVDSRWRSSGTHADFQIELPRDVSTTRTSSVYVASCSFSNTFSTIEPGVNDELYFLTENPQAVPPITEDSRWLYGLYQRDQLVTVAAGANLLYMVWRVRDPRDGSFQYRYQMATMGPGSYEVSAFAAELQSAVRLLVGTGAASTATWRPVSETYEIVYRSVEDDVLNFYIPSAGVLRGLVNAPNSRFRPAEGTDAVWPPPAGIVNDLLNIPSDFVSPGGAFTVERVPFANSQTTGRVATERPVRGIRADLLISAPPQPPLGIAALAAHLQFHLRFWFRTMGVTATGDRELTLDTGTAGWTLRLASDDELRDPSWRARFWPGPDYDTTAPRSYNAQLGLRGPSALARRQTIQSIPAAREAWVFRLAKAQYADGADLAAALQALMQAAVDGVAVTFDGYSQVLVFRSAPPTTLQIPTERELRRRDWRSANWDPYPSNGPDARYDITNPTSLNGQLYMPSPSELRETTTSGNIDLVPFREVYLSSSITNYRTLQAGTAAQDIMARIPIDVNYGQVVVYRHLGPADALSASDMNFRTVRFTFRDWAGRVVPIDQPAIIELAFLDSDPFSM